MRSSWNAISFTLPRQGKNELCVSSRTKSFGAMCFVSNESLYENSVCGTVQLNPRVPSSPFISNSDSSSFFKGLGFVLGFFPLSFCWRELTNVQLPRMDLIISWKIAELLPPMPFNLSQQLDEMTCQKFRVFSSNRIPTVIIAQDMVQNAMQNSALDDLAKKINISSSSSFHLTSSYLSCSRNSQFSS